MATTNTTERTYPLTTAPATEQSVTYTPNPKAEEVGVTVASTSAAPVYARFAGAAAAVEAAGSFLVEPGRTRWIPRDNPQGPAKVSIISAGVADVEVEFPT